VPRLDEEIDKSIHTLKVFGTEVDAGHWQGYETKGKPDLVTEEIMNLTLVAPIPVGKFELRDHCKPNMPWAEEEFQERVGRVPRNPHASLQNWPWWREQSESTMYEGMFSHTYSERFWPRYRMVSSAMGEAYNFLQDRRGIRYRYGDLDDVLKLLQKHPHTRQATFPIFFPEDTGAVHGGRIPCTLHYHFLLREDRLNLWYPIRSCDAVRHFRDDIYMAGRLCQWVIEQLQVMDNDYDAQEFWEGVTPGHLFFTAYSFHVHAGDRHLL
jgi:thymidylate synthase